VRITVDACNKIILCVDLLTLLIKMYSRVVSYLYDIDALPSRAGTFLKRFTQDLKYSYQMYYFTLDEGIRLFEVIQVYPIRCHRNFACTVSAAATSARSFTKLFLCFM